MKEKERNQSVSFSLVNSQHELVQLRNVQLKSNRSKQKADLTLTQGKDGETPFRWLFMRQLQLGYSSNISIHSLSRLPQHLINLHLRVIKWKCFSENWKDIFLPLIFTNNFHGSSIMNFGIWNSDSSFIGLCRIIPLFSLLLVIKPAFIQWSNRKNFQPQTY